MGYIMYEASIESVQGTSLSKTISKEDGLVWPTNSTASYELTDSAGETISSGALTKSVDEKTFTLFIPKADTATIDGKHLLYVYLEDSVDLTIKEPIALYKINYRDKRAK